MPFHPPKDPSTPRPAPAPTGGYEFGGKHFGPPPPPVTSFGVAKQEAERAREEHLDDPGLVVATHALVPVAWVRGIFSAEIDEPGQGLARGKLLETGAAYLLPGKYIKSIAGVESGPPLLHPQHQYELNFGPGERYEDPRVITPVDRARFEQRQRDIAAGRRAPDPVPVLPPGFAPPPVNVPPRPVAAPFYPRAAGPIPGTVSTRSVRESVPALPLATLRGLVIAAADKVDWDWAFIPAPQGSKRSGRFVRVPPLVGTFSATDIAPLTLLAIAGADDAEGIRRELVTEYADP